MIDHYERFSFVDMLSEYTFGVCQVNGELYLSIIRKQYHPEFDGNSTIHYFKQISLDGEIIWDDLNLTSAKAQDYISNFMIKYFKMKAFW